MKWKINICGKNKFPFLPVSSDLGKSPTELFQMFQAGMFNISRGMLQHGDQSFNRKRTQNPAPGGAGAPLGAAPAGGELLGLSQRLRGAARCPAPPEPGDSLVGPPPLPKVGPASPMVTAAF